MSSSSSGRRQGPGSRHRYICTYRPRGGGAGDRAMRTRWIHLAPRTPLALAAGLSAACGPPPTSSASVSADGTLVFTAATGKANNVIVTTDGSAVVLADGGDDITAGAGCTQRSRNSVRCPGVTTLKVILGDGDDRFLNGSSLGTVFPGVAGGPGDDVLHGGDGHERLRGTTPATPGRPPVTSRPAASDDRATEDLRHHAVVPGPAWPTSPPFGSWPTASHGRRPRRDELPTSTANPIRSTTPPGGHGGTLARPWRGRRRSAARRCAT